MIFLYTIAIIKLHLW